ncbi:2-oxo acid dehydrogenase subunit E2 [Streptomyces sp. NPDC059524]|uniref:2-oxo acid dehydrogenase subunit E2 n=1 Tax=Streptomyces sp. NPDC059524 TaxID=3346856 RepID=UPI0036C05050
MTDVVVPKINNNDLSYTLVEWLVPSGDVAREGEAIAEIETSKATHELVSPGDGVLHHTVPAGTECGQGDVIGRINGQGAGASEGPFPVEVEPPRVVTAAPAPVGHDVVVTEPARARALELGIPEERLHTLGKALVQRKDVELLAPVSAAPEGPGEPQDPAASATARHRFTKNQRAVASVVSRSHGTIPAAFVAVTAHVDEALTTAQQLTKEHGQFIGLPDLLVKAVAAQRPAHPLLFASRVDDHTAVLAQAAHVGVTLDLGQGLFVPVVADAENLTHLQVARKLAEYKLKALDGTSFTAADLDGANIVLSLHNDPDVTLAGPVVFPGHTCVIALTGTRSEVVLAADGRPGTRKVATIGLSYDHRVVNGRDAVAFLRDVKRLLETPAVPAARP